MAISYFNVYLITWNFLTCSFCYFGWFKYINFCNTYFSLFCKKKKVPTPHTLICFFFCKEHNKIIHQKPPLRKMHTLFPCNFSNTIFSNTALIEVNRVDWLGNLTTFFVMCFCSAFPFWNMKLTMHK